MSDHFDSDIAWAVELLQEWGAEQTCGSTRAGSVWTESEFGVDGEELTALKTAIERLSVENPDEHAAIVAEFATTGCLALGGRMAGRATAHALLVDAITRLALWVDEAMGDA